MNCRTLVDFLTDYLDGRLTFRQRFLLRLHLLLCGHCRVYLRDFRVTIQASRAAHREINAADLPAVPESLVQAILAAQRADSAKPARPFEERS